MFTSPVSTISLPGESAVEFTIKQLALKVLGMTGSRSELVFKPLPADDPRQRQPEISLARKALQWQPTVDLEQGLSATIESWTSSWTRTGRR